MVLRLYGTISGCGRSAGTVIPSLGSGRYAPGPNIGLPSWLKGSDPNYTINVCWGQPGVLATVSNGTAINIHVWFVRVQYDLKRRQGDHLPENDGLYEEIS